VKAEEGQGERLAGVHDVLYPLAIGGGWGLWNQRWNQAGGSEGKSACVATDYWMVRSLPPQPIDFTRQSRFVPVLHSERLSTRYQVEVHNEASIGIAQSLAALRRSRRCPLSARMLIWLGFSVFGRGPWLQFHLGGLRETALPGGGRSCPVTRSCRNRQRPSSARCGGSGSARSCRAP
jgi:hypothetical protein